jgi:hypothetical protein
MLVKTIWNRVHKQPGFLYAWGDVQDNDDGELSLLIPVRPRARCSGGGKRRSGYACPSVAASSSRSGGRALKALVTAIAVILTTAACDGPVGPEGPAGPQGEQGEKGLPGQDGADGDTQPWSIHIAPADLRNAGGDFWPAPTFGSGVSAAGVAFNDGVFGRVWYGLQLPGHYAAGSDIQVDMRWIPVSGFGAPTFPCDSVWWANSPVVSRADSSGFVVGTTWEIPRGFDETQTLLTATQDQFDNSITSETYMTIDGTDLQPGDMLTVALNRDGDEVADTCEGMMITGLTAHPGS